MKTERLDKLVTLQHPERSRGYWQAEIESGRVTINGEVVTKPALRLDTEAEIFVVTPEATEEAAKLPDPKLHILYEDDAIIVLNKQRGVIVHPADRQKSGTLADALRTHFPAIAEALYDPDNPVSHTRPGIVHRLDRNTTGVLVVAKTPKALKFLAKEIIAHRMQKYYMALVHGHLPEEITVDKPLGRSPSNRQVITIQKDGKPSVSKFIPRQNFTLLGQPVAFITAMPITGRTHQLRVHLKSISRPVLGDPVYTTSAARALSDQLGLTSQLLHAETLRFRHPLTREYVEFSAELPDQFSRVLTQCQQA